MTLTAQLQCIYVDDAALMPDRWCVAHHYLHGEQPRLIFIDALKLSEVYSLPNARRNSQWIKLVSAGTHIYVKIEMVGSKAECIAELSRQVLSISPRPDCNAFGHHTFGQVRRIVCSNGKTYNTQIEACADLGLNQAQLSKHLNGGYKHVKGYTFAYSDQVE